MTLASLSDIFLCISHLGCAVYWWCSRCKSLFWTNFRLLAWSYTPLSGAECWGDPLGRMAPAVGLSANRTIAGGLVRQHSCAFLTCAMSWLSC